MGKNYEKMIAEKEQNFKVVPVEGRKNLYAVEEFAIFSGYKYVPVCYLEFDESKNTWYELTHGLGHGIASKTDLGTSDKAKAIHQIAVNYVKYEN